MDIKNAVRLTGTAISKAGGRPLLVAQKYSPEILVGTGIVAGIGATVMASRATLNLEDRLDVMRAEIDEAKARMTETDDEGNPLYNPSDIQKDLTKVYLRGTGRIVRLYLPAITLTGISVASVLAGHGILKKRNAAILAAYKLAEESYAAYRERVREELGEEKDLDFVTGSPAVEEKDKETGVTKVVSHFDPNKLKTPYGRFFDEGNINFKKNPEINLITLRGHQAYFNQMLQSRGHVFLNEVYDALGFERTTAGQAVGWVLGGDGDNFIDFGIYDFTNERAREFVNGNERAIYLDFNVDGVVLDKIEGPFRK